MSFSVNEQHWTIAHLDCALRLDTPPLKPHHPFPIYGEQEKRPKGLCIPCPYIRHYIGNGKYTSTSSSHLTNSLIAPTSPSRFGLTKRQIQAHLFIFIYQARRSFDKDVPGIPSTVSGKQKRGWIWLSLTFPCDSHHPKRIERLCIKQH
jgi:hypothetical protein